MISSRQLKLKKTCLKKVTAPPPADLDPATDISWEILYSSSKHTSFPIYGVGHGHIRKSAFTDLGEVVFMGPDSVIRPYQMIAKGFPLSR